MTSNGEDGPEAVPEIRFIKLPLSELMKTMFGAETHDHERHHMVSLGIQQRIGNLVDTADVETLCVLRLICAQGQGHNPALTQLDGQLVAILRAVHHVDPDTGESIDDLKVPAGGQGVEGPPAG